MLATMKRLALILCLMWPSWGWAERLQVNSQYLCIAEKATGFMFRDGEWKSTDFKTDKLKWIVRSFGEPTFKQKGSVTQFGGDGIAKFICNVRGNWMFFCTEGEIGEFKLNTETNKYIRTHTDFTLQTMTEKPFIEIGSCSEF